MILLDNGHQIVKETLVARLGPSREEFRAQNKEITLMVSDFDDVTYCIKSQGDSFSLFCKIHGFDALVPYGVEEYLRSVYNSDDFVLDFNSSTFQEVVYNFSMTLDLSRDYGSESEAVAEKVSCVKRNVLAGPFMWYFNSMKSGTTPSGAIKVPFRSNEAMYLKKGKEDSAVVIFSVTFPEKTDWVVAEVFLREFADARRDAALQLAPAVSFSKSVPMELEGMGVDEGEGVCFISFALFKRHWDTKAEASVSAICQFRNYLHYHIKCSKAYMHMRMRKRVDDLLMVLNRAKLPAEAAVDKKTWGGKTCAK